MTESPRFDFDIIGPPITDEQRERLRAIVEADEKRRAQEEESIICRNLAES